MKLNRNELANLNDAYYLTDPNEFEIKTENTGVGETKHVWIKENETEYRVIDITDYGCW